jgi:hypothetical protein
MPARRDLPAYQGDDFLHELRFVDEATQTPIDVSGRVFESQIRKRPEYDTVVATFNVDMTDAANGVVGFWLPHSVMKDLLPGKYRYDCQQTVGGVVLSLTFGTFEVTGEVTRP